MADTIAGGLIGWRRTVVDNGVVIKFQVARSAEAFHAKDFDLAVMAMNDRQLRSLARDLTRAAEERGIALASPKRRWLIPPASSASWAAGIARLGRYAAYRQKG